MDKNRLFYLIDQVNKGAATPDEIAEYDAYLNQLTSGQKAWDSEGLGEEAQTREELRAMLEAKINPQPARRIRLWPRIAAAASILIACSIGGYFLLNKRPVQLTAQIQKQDFAPGHKQATLTLANGQKILLTKGMSGKLAQQGNTTILVNTGKAIAYQAGNSGTNSVVTYNTLSTARGEQSPYPLVLADGTKVWLDAASSITFPTAFNGKERIVKITGEAYFEVAHNAAQPFKVTVKGQTIEDIGTAFNVNAYEDEPAIKTTLLEGSVKVLNTNGEKLLTPGQQAIIKNGEPAIRVMTVNTEAVTAWKNGYFMFAHENIQSVMRKISRWYNVDIDYDPNITNNSFSGSMTRYGNASDVLDMLQLTGLVHFKIKERRIEVMP
jgi:ferric-dicitrate binding protein FerR (iron transport regulator)